MKYLNHITLNSGHCRKSYPREISKDIYFSVKSMLNRSLKGEEVEVLDGFIMKTTASPIGYLITLFGYYEGDKVPVLTIGCSYNDTGELWHALHSTIMIPLATKSSDKVPLPYIADRLEVGAAMFPGALSWTGDFSRCMGWVCLAPDKVSK